MAEYKDYYKILGVNKNATDAEIKKAFKVAARKYHPDLHPESEKAAMTEKFKDVNEAYAVLSDKQKRTIYDQVGQEGYQNYARGGGASAGRSRSSYTGGNPFGGGAYRQASGNGNTYYNFSNHGGGDFGGADFSDFFQSIFGGLGGMGGMGGFSGFGGRGASRTAGQRSGDMDAELALNLEDAHRGGPMQLTLPGGRNVTVKLPAGVGEGKRIKLKGLGNPTPRGNGDLYLTIKIRPHLTYRLEGDDLHVPVTLMPWTAALGGTIYVPTLDGPVKVKVPAGTHNGKKLKLSGKGLNSKGSLYVTLTIDVPRTLTKEQKDLFTQLAQIS
ncbi:DnaJ C-terminal domain-containing protein [Candidatus Avelusimicrobium facis]|uniref:DnaJ C-terminal domain-containing protein n=1 Tax=Candidatus Avelusimicrobium facis TaxID=3416203 RepID=UPI003D0B7440